MIRKLLIISLLFIALFTVSCDMFKKTEEVTGPITEIITGIDSTYVGTWYVDETPDVSNFDFIGSYITIKEDGSMDFYFRKSNRTFNYPSSSILKVVNSYIATYNETDPNNNNAVLKKHILNMTFEERNNGNGTFSSIVNVSYSVEENNAGTIIKGVFVRKVQ